MTRKIQTILFALALAAPASLVAQAKTGVTAAAAPSPTQTKIGVIDIQTAILATNEGQRDFNSLTTKFQPKQTELQGLNKEVADMQKQLDTQGDKLNEDARSTLVKNIDTKKKSLQRNFEDAQTDFEAQKNDILKSLGNKVYTTLDKYAKENGYSMIVDVSNPQSPILWASQGTNITKEIVDAYNVTSGVAAPAKPATTGAALPSAPKPTSRAAARPH